VCGREIVIEDALGHSVDSFEIATVSLWSECSLLILTAKLFNIEHCNEDVCRMIL
jgi:hypothetical protein